MTLPGEDQVEVDGESRYKSRKQSERDEAVRERATGGASEPIDSKPYSGSNGAGAADPDSMSNSDFMNGSEEDHAILARMKKIDREELRPGEQSWRERQLTKAGIRQPASFRLKKKDELRMKQTPIGSAKYNPVLVRTREHINSSDLPPSFDHFKVPPLSADEIDQKQKDLHATYWNKYAAWKDARPEEYQRWLARLEKREEEQSFHWQQSQLPPKKRLAALKNQMDSKLLPEKNRNDFEEALKNDSTLKDAVEKLGRNEVLRRWSAYQVFLDAEIAAETRERNVMHSAKKKIQRDQALNAEDAITTLNDPNLNLNVTQKKKLYHLMLGAKTRVNEVPFWTDPDPRFEGEHDWKMADAFIKPPLLPPLHLLREYSARPEVNSNFSSLHKFLHFERLRQTVQFLREHKKKVVRDGKRLLEFNPSTYVETLISDTKDWSKITQDYPFLSDILLSGAQNLYRSPWPHADQKAFLTALHKNLLTIAQLLGQPTRHAHMHTHTRAHTRVWAAAHMHSKQHALNSVTFCLPLSFPPVLSFSQMFTSVVVIVMPLGSYPFQIIQLQIRMMSFDR